MNEPFAPAPGTRCRQQRGLARSLLQKRVLPTKDSLKMLYFNPPYRHDPQHNWMIDMKTVHYLLLGVFAAAAAAAQPIYETPGKDGPVFSDLPSQGRDLPSQIGRASCRERV